MLILQSRLTDYTFAISLRAIFPEKVNGNRAQAFISGRIGGLPQVTRLRLVVRHAEARQGADDLDRDAVAEQRVALSAQVLERQYGDGRPAGLRTISTAGSSISCFRSATSLSMSSSGTARMSRFAFEGNSALM